MTVIVAPTPRGQRPHCRAFTLIELVVGIVVISIVTGGIAASMHKLVQARMHATGKRQAFARASLAAAKIADDLANVARDADLTGAKVLVLNNGAASAEHDELLVLTRTLQPVRGVAAGSVVQESVEGDEREVQYRIEPDPKDPSTSILWRRVDMGLDGAIDAGGVASPIVSGIVSLACRAMEKDTWKISWDSDTDGLPWAVRVQVVARDESGKFEATARRIVAIDRVPIPPRDEDDTSTETESENPTDPAAGTGTGASGGGQ